YANTFRVTFMDALFLSLCLVMGLGGTLIL
ncbi:energy-coupling factor transporter transmembrane protein EcfT, partial [Listeria monocytogenes]|nr:energy-coupling factor transporter transmembrane protein EcfT [Listeria monocytogenes]